jgi:PAS domain S-box-containing protein
VEDLVGRRIVALVPPELREAHVAGFSRHLTTGEARVLGVPVQLPALRADGSILLCDVLIEQRSVVAGRHLYVARLDPVS